MPLKSRPRRHRLEDPARTAAGRPHHQCRTVAAASASPRRPACGASSGWRMRASSAAIARCSTPRRSGIDVVAFCLIGLHHQSETELKAFADRTRNWPIVRAAWMVSGESDFMLHCVASDLATFQSFVIEELTSAAQCRYGPHRADHPPGQGRRAGGDLRRGVPTQGFVCASREATYRRRRWHHGKTCSQAFFRTLRPAFSRGHVRP